MIGTELRDLVLAELYIVQADSVSNVAQTSWLVWKSVVANTNRTLAAIMPTLMSTVIHALADDDVERRAAAGR